VCYQNAWEVLLEYYEITDKSYEIYAAATLFNPCFRKEYFLYQWTDDAAAFIEPIIAHNRGVWEWKYQEEIPVTESVPPQGIVNTFIYDFQQARRQGNDDDFQRYTTGGITKLDTTDWKAQNLFQWWNTCDFTTLRQMAFDTLSVPAMSAELERVFSQSKRTWTDDRNALKTESFEALQCLKQWSLQGLYKF
jgi:hAT family C-terminal dimerisation region